MSRQRYDKRARKLLAKPGHEVFRRNFVLSDFSKSFNAKFARKFLKARVVKYFVDRVKPTALTYP